MTEADKKIDEDWENFVNDCLDSKITDAKEQGKEQGIEQTYLKMIFKGMDLRLIGCSDELFRKLYEKAKQMNN